MIAKLLISIALAMDAAGVIFSLTLSGSIKGNWYIKYVFSFSFFQFLLAYAGSFVGNFMIKNFAVISKYVSFAILLIIAISFIKDSKKNTSIHILCNYSSCIIMGISVSIDAFAVGVSLLSYYNKNSIIEITLLIGLVTAIISIINCYAALYIRTKNNFTKYYGYISGIILMLIGLKIILF